MLTQVVAVLNKAFLDDIKWTSDGLVPAIAQDAKTQKILMMAWMNEASLRHTVEEGYAVYWSRSRQKLWRKGESSGNQQIVKSIRIDCDKDVILLSVEQLGGIACHTGRESCFYSELIDGEWRAVEDIIKDPKEIYS